MSAEKEKHGGEEGQRLRTRREIVGGLLAGLGSLWAATQLPGCAGSTPEPENPASAELSPRELQSLLIANGLSTGIQPDGSRINDVRLAAVGSLMDILATEESLRAEGAEVVRLRRPSGGFALVVVEREGVKLAIPHQEQEQSFIHPNGIVNTYYPEYTGELARAVVFLPGYRRVGYDYWQHYKLKEQFKSSGIPAFFEGIETQMNSHDTARRWDGDLDSAIHSAVLETKVNLAPHYQTTIVAHSSGYLEVDKILSREGGKKPNKIILFDCAPFSEDTIKNMRQWLAEPANELIVVSTRRRSRYHARILNMLRQNVSAYRGVPQAIDGAKVTHITANINHHSMPRKLTGRILQLAR